MCGIAGFHHSDPSRPADAELLRAMTRELVHRGPDGEGTHCVGPLALGHRRLSIIDLDTGDQPMFGDDGNLALVFNGEIYNYIELRDELRALGHEFRTDSDTEVIIRGYQQWGIDCQNHFNGMWAFALWDERQRRLLLSRDRLGEKPLHYAEHDGTLVFASEIKSLFAYGVPRLIDLAWVEVYTCLSFVPAPHSFFKGVHKLPPGHCLIREGESISVRAYWDLPDVPDGDMNRDANAIEAAFAELFDDSVRLRMRSDVPFGAFLSGGLDSGCVVAAMAEHAKHPVQTFTIGFAQPRYDERPLARLVAEAFGTEHHEQLVEPEVFAESVERVVRHYDEPFGDSSAIPTAYVSRHARSRVKMVLSGDGGDECLSGYTIYQGEKFASRYGRLPGAVRWALPRAAAGAAALFRGAPRYRLNRVRNVLRTSSQDFEKRLIEKVAWASPELIDELLTHHADRIPVGDWIADVMARCPYTDPFYRLMYYNLKHSLPDKMLVKVDRMSMAYSLEVRAPFLDHRLIELMAAAHKDVKMRGFERKSVLRRTVARRLPRALLSAPKKGFAVPVGDWFRGRELAETAGKLLEPGGAGLRDDILRDIIRRNGDGSEDFGNLLWVLTLLDRVVRSG